VFNRTKEADMPAKKLKEFLDGNKVKYKTIGHSIAYTAQEIAEAAAVPGQELAKTIIVRIDGELAMAVLPASYRVDTNRLAKAAGAKKVELAGEEEFSDQFPGCDLGAMPPFGNLYGMKVFVAEKLAAAREFAFNAGTHRELVRLSYADFERLVKPVTAAFAVN
jgi:Ala-tRNA(Pro) deacylase